MIARQIGLAGGAALLTVAILSNASAQSSGESQPPAALTEPTPPAAPSPAAEEAGPAQAMPAPESGAETGEAAAAPGAQADAAAAVESLSPMIGDVQIVGPWTDGDRRGIWRTVMLQSLDETTGNRFFVQQLEKVSETVQVSSSTEITEIAEIDGAVVGYRVDEPSPDRPEQLTLFLEIVPLDGEISETYELFFTPGEPYIFGPASN